MGTQETNATTKFYTTSNAQQTTPEITKLLTDAETTLPTTTLTTTTEIPTTTPTITTTKPTTPVRTAQPQILRKFQVELRVLNEQWVPGYAVTGSLDYEILNNAYKTFVSNEFNDINQFN